MTQRLYDAKICPISRADPMSMTPDVIGTLGLLLKAKRKGLVSPIKPLIKKILDNDIWIKDEIVQGILRDAGEKY